MKRLREYARLLRKFLKTGYTPAVFSASPRQYGGLLFRHDVDFDVALADQLSRIEDELGVNSTYFFMLRSRSYNLFDPATEDVLLSLMERKHSVSLHFDPVIYTDSEKGLALEMAMFERLVKVKPECISIHRPTELFLGHDGPINGTRHTYQSIYCKDIHYCSDSHGIFRFGHPLESDAFLSKKSMHLLIHPVWWVTNWERPAEILTEYLHVRFNGLRRHIAVNCTPYRDYLEMLGPLDSL